MPAFKPQVEVTVTSRKIYSEKEMQDFDKIIKESYSYMKYSEYFNREIRMDDYEKYFQVNGAINVIDGLWHVIPEKYRIYTDKVHQYQKWKDRRNFAKVKENKDFEKMAESMSQSKRVDNSELEY